MQIKPKLNYQFLGTNIKLDNTKVYNAVLATNQPDYIEKGKIFVILPDNQSVLLDNTEYERIN